MAKGYPTRCKIVDIAGDEVFPGLVAKTPDPSKPYIGQTGTAELLEVDGWDTVRITLDDGNIIYGYQCWWKRLDDECKESDA